MGKIIWKDIRLILVLLELLSAFVFIIHESPYGYRIFTLDVFHITPEQRLHLLTSKKKGATLKEDRKTTPAVLHLNLGIFSLHKTLWLMIPLVKVFVGYAILVILSQHISPNIFQATTTLIWFFV